MKIAFCFYSSTGNTQLACRYIARRIANAQFDLIDVIKDGTVDMSPYQVVGLAAPTIFMGLPYRFRDFVEQLPPQNDKPAFVFNTFGMMSGQTLKMLDRLATARGFCVIAGHSLHTPENYPPLIVKGWGSADAPDPKEMVAFDQFIAQLAQRLLSLQAGQPAAQARIKIGLLESLLRPGSPAQARKEIGPLYVDEARCDGCGMCGQVCPYGAIEFASAPAGHPAGKPIFNSERCCGCWSCFNHCPQQAIFTAKIKGTGHYPQPNEQFAAKLAI